MPKPKTKKQKLPAFEAAIGEPLNVEFANKLKPKAKRIPGPVFDRPQWLDQKQ